MKMTITMTVRRIDVGDGSFDLLMPIVIRDFASEQVVILCLSLFLLPGHFPFVRLSLCDVGFRADLACVRAGSECFPGVSAGQMKPGNHPMHAKFPLLLGFLLVEPQMPNYAGKRNPISAP